MYIIIKVASFFAIIYETIYINTGVYIYKYEKKSQVWYSVLHINIHHIMKILDYLQNLDFSYIYIM